MILAQPYWDIDQTALHRAVSQPVLIPAGLAARAAGGGEEGAEIGHGVVDSKVK